MADLSRYSTGMHKTDTGNWVDYDEAMNVIGSLEKELEELEDQIDNLKSDIGELEDQLKEATTTNN